MGAVYHPLELRLSYISNTCKEVQNKHDLFKTSFRIPVEWWYQLGITQYDKDIRKKKSWKNYLEKNKTSPFKKTQKKTFICANLSNKYTSQFHVLFRVQQHTTTKFEDD